MDSKTKQDSITNSILIGRCECDNIVKFPFYWCEEIVDEAKKQGIDVIDLKRENFIEEKAKKRLTENNPFLVCLNGHGDELCAMGYKRHPIITTNKNDYLLKGKLAHIISCKTGLVLAQSAIDKGCKGYIGYKDLFKFWNIEADPSKDIVSKMFMEAVNIVSITLLKGGSVSDAYNKSQKIYQKHIDECTQRFFGTKDSEIKRDVMGDIIGALLNNKKNQIFLL